MLGILLCLISVSNAEKGSCQGIGTANFLMHKKQERCFGFLIGAERSISDQLWSFLQYQAIKQNYIGSEQDQFIDCVGFEKLTR